MLSNGSLCEGRFGGEEAGKRNVATEKTMVASKHINLNSSLRHCVVRSNRCEETVLTYYQRIGNILMLHTQITPWIQTCPRALDAVKGLKDPFMDQHPVLGP